MRVLMFGWEFPPHIAGGLGTASYGLTRGLASHRDIEVIFVVPKAYGDEDQSMVRLIGANTVPVAFKKVQYKYFRKPVAKIEVFSRLVPYTDPDEFWKMTRGEVADTDVLISTNKHGKVDFTGSYGATLMEEIHKYSVVAQVIASEQKFDIIHAHDWLAYPAGMAAKAVSGKPLVIHVHATDFDRSGGNVNPVVYAMEKEGMDAADKIITVSNLTRDIVINRYNIDPGKVETVYNAVEPLHHSEFDIPGRSYDDKIVTFLGRITMQKGPEYFIEAARMVLSRMHNVRFVMAGSGDMMERMMRHAAALKITDRFHFTGFLRGNDVFTMLRMSDVYVMPSVSEPFGISPLEAMQSNVPVIISKQSGVAEVLTHAVKVDFWDIEAMADAIYGILTYPALSRMFIMNGKEEVDELKWEKAAGHVKSIYSEVLQQTR
ncbi:MAG TPA: glycosyltransferase family 4 protein [Bacteroidales bacterium]|nr:glycosyltransferase family 4 protein [Bacteroidales bacterium]MDI9533830.1 glycosyltransferase family 4 protein [Bacteroidota bacterium]OPZ56358.1 MAG: Glycogen synthase [Bacteroidetes bacterium ADurb.BinA012]MZQ78470.1 glycosyltransferase [Bacteroidales bacterium]HHU99827.1 glycosyltransferase family 4 protein [Bacteroidales bacterium]